MLMKEDYRQQIDPKFKKKIETLVRKSAGTMRSSDHSVDDGESFTLCPYCSKNLNEFDLICHNCKNTIPFCIATGYHVVKEDFTTCPSCHFPAIMSYLSR